MALFGAPIAHEDHAQRACYAALLEKVQGEWSLVCTAQNVWKLAAVRG